MRKSALLAALLTAAGLAFASGAAALTPVPGSPFAVNARVGAHSVAFAPGRGLLATAGSGGISVFSVDAGTGALTEAPSSPFRTGCGALAFSPGGGTLACVNDFRTSVFAIDQSDGRLSELPGSPLTTATVGYSASFSPDGALLAVAGIGGGFGRVAKISVFAVGGAGRTFTEVPGSPFEIGFFAPLSVAFSPSGRLLATADDLDDGTVSVLAADRASGALTEVAGSPFATGSSPLSVAFSPDGRLLATANSDGDTVSLFAVNQLSGTLTEVPSSPFATGNRPISVAFSRDGSLLATADVPDSGPPASGTLSLFSVDRAAGALHPVAGSPFVTGLAPRSVAFDPDGDHLAAANGGGTDSISVFDVSSLAPPAGVPRSIAVPVVTADVVRRTLTAAHGTWHGNPTSFVYQWLRCSDTGSACVPISGATGQTYALTATDIGSRLRFQETASNALGAGAPALSLLTRVVASAPPVGIRRPTIAGIAQQGQLLAERRGSSTNFPDAYAIRWMRCDVTGHACTAIPGATAETYRVRADDVGATLAVEETAANSAGTGDPQVSVATEVVSSGLGTLSLDGRQEPLVMDWGRPFDAALTGCPNGLAVVTIAGRVVGTNRAEPTLVFLPETPVGSGTYAGKVPPFFPLTGNARVKSAVTCPPHSALLPSMGPASGGTSVLVTGSGFTGATGVSFGAVPARSFTVQSDEIIRAVAPAGTGTVPVTVSHGAAGSGVALDDYTYQSIESVSPRSGPNAGGTWVTIKGTGLDAARDVRFGATPVRFIQRSNTEIDAQSPRGEGSQHISVATSYAGSTPATSADLFTFGAPTAPAAATASGGMPGLRGGARTVRSPRGSPQTITGDILRWFGHHGDAVAHALLTNHVADAIGALAHRPDCEHGMAVIVEEIMIALTPLLGTVSELLIADFVTWELASFLVNPAAAMATALVYAVAGVMVPLILEWAARQIVISILPDLLPECPDDPPDEPNGLFDPSGTVLGVNGNPVGGATATLLRADTAAGPFEPVDPASPGIRPAINPETTAADGVFHWDVSRGYYKVSASAPGCWVPGHPSEHEATIGPYPVPPEQVGLTITLACHDEPPPPTPSVDSMSVSSGSPAGGTTTTIVGSGFTPASTVTFGATPARDVVFVSPHTLSVVAPAGRGAVDVVVRTAGNQSSTSASDTFFYGLPPSVTGLSTDRGPVSGGTSVTVSGTGFTGATIVAFGGRPATSFTVLSDTELRVTAPPAQPGSVHVLVATPAGGSARADADRFTYLVPVPVSTGPPAITGVATQGNTLTESHGTWANGPTSRAYQWLDCDAFGRTCSPIAGATGQTYVLRASDVGQTIRVQETASNAGGTSSPATSAASRVVRPAAPVPVAPSNEARPVATGQATVGRVLSASTGRWSGTAPISHAYQWQRCTARCSSLAGATGRTHRLSPRDAGARMRVMVTARNAAGGASAISAAVGPVRRPRPTAAQIRRSLRGQIAPTGPAARIAAVVRAGGYTYAFRALTAGRARVAWYDVRKRHGRRRPAAVLIARGTLTFSAAGTRKLKVSATPRGMALLRSELHTRAGRLALSATASFTPSGGAAVSVREPISLAR